MIVKNRKVVWVDEDDHSKGTTVEEYDAIIPDPPPEEGNRKTTEQQARAYLALPTPTNAQNVRAIKGIIRMLLNQHDTTD